MKNNNILWFRRKVGETFCRIGVFKYNDDFNFVISVSEDLYDGYLYSPSAKILQQFDFNPVERKSISYRDYIEQIGRNIDQEIKEYSEWFFEEGAAVNTKRKTSLFPNIPIEDDIMAKIDTFQYGNFCLDVLTFNKTYSAWLYMPNRPFKFRTYAGKMDTTIGDFLKNVEKTLDKDMKDYRKSVLNEKQTSIKEEN